MDKMKLLLVTSIMSVCMLTSPVSSLAKMQDSNTGSSKPSNTNPKNGRLKIVKIPNRHRMPSRVYMEYVYDGNGITVYAPDAYTRFEISITEENDIMGISGELSEENGYHIETGALTGTYTIVCTTEDGSIFSGTMTTED